MIEQYNNKTKKVGEDLKNTVQSGSKIDVAAAIFSIYGYSALSNELNKVERFRFVFTDPTFIEFERGNMENRLFEIGANERKKALGGSELEIKLKNELKSKEISQECRNWIEKKAEFKTNKTNRYIQPQFIVKNPSNNYVYNGIDEFSSAGFGYERDDAIIRHIIKTDEPQATKEFIENFESVWNDEESLRDIKDEVIEYITALYKENSPEFIYYITLFNIFNEFLEDVIEDEFANEKTGFKDSIIWNKLYEFQKDAVLGIINKLERYNGCILADSVGLGKTYSALAVIKYYQERNKSILVLCPKKLDDNWLTFLNNYEDNPFVGDRFNYDVLYHTDLLRTSGMSNSMDLSRVNWSNYDLLVIDESHNFRNNDQKKERLTRYQALLNNIIKSGVKTKVLMLSATPVNNRFNDLKNQIALAYEGDVSKIDEKLGVSQSIEVILKEAQESFNAWSKLPIDSRTVDNLLKALKSNFNFFKLLDSLTIARSRKHIEKYYNMDEIGRFPNRLKPITHRSEITDIDNFIEIEDLYNELSRFSLSVYTPFDYILPDKMGFYSERYDTDVSKNVSFKQASREQGLMKLMRVNMLKRLESSIDSFRITLNHFVEKNEYILNTIREFEESGVSTTTDITNLEEVDLEEEEWLDEEYSIGETVKINLSDMNTDGWKQDLEYDVSIAQKLLEYMDRVTPVHDQKLNDLKTFIKEKLEDPVNPGNKKVLIFTAFADTADYIYANLSEFNKNILGLETAKIVGSNQNECTLNISTQFNNLLINFSPRAKERRDNSKPEIDVLIATDCISEGQNLQDCDMLINYDIHWNPVRIIQRFGRIDRIGSTNKDIQLVNFWPQLSLDDYINLKNRVENKMFLVDATATGEDNVLTNESSDLLFRKKQLEKLQNEVVDLEDMDSSVSITDLGLNDFRMDLVNYIKERGKGLDDVPNGMHTVCNSDNSNAIDPGVIFVLKNINRNVNIENSNHLHPFYLMYIDHAGKVISNHLEVKNTLDILRGICKGNTEPIKSAYKLFNRETNGGRDMDKYSNLLNKTIESILEVKNESEVQSLFSKGGTTALFNNIKGLDDFELITFFVIN